MTKENFKIEEKQQEEHYVIVRNLNKHYWKNHILKDINFEIKRWECLWFIGHNGAWKTTTIKILIWVNKPDKWTSITINGINIETFKNKNKVSYLPEKVNFQEYLTGREFLDYIISLNELEGKVSEEKIKEILKTVKFPENYINKRIKTYSKGMQQRIWLAWILLNENNELIVLDEPVSWLDPIWQNEMVELIKILKDKGKTIFITTHQLSEVEELCDTIILLKDWVIKDKRAVKDVYKNYNSLIDYYIEMHKS